MQKCLTAASEDWQGGGGGVGTPPAENLGSWCHLHEPELEERLFIHVHLSMFFVERNS